MALPPKSDAATFTSAMTHIQSVTEEPEPNTSRDSPDARVEGEDKEDAVYYNSFELRKNKILDIRLTPSKAVQA